jgi:hypothetical protein
MYTMIYAVYCDTMHGKCKIIIFKILVFWGMEPCNLTGGYEGFSQDILPPTFDGL